LNDKKAEFRHLPVLCLPFFKNVLFVLAIIRKLRFFVVMLFYPM